MEQGLFRSRLFPLRGASARARYRAAAIRPCLGCAEVNLRSLTAIPAFGRASAGARYRAAAVRPCLGSAEVSQSDADMFAVLQRLPRIARLAIEARPVGRARAGPAQRE